MAEKDPTVRLRRAVKENNLSLVKRLVQRTDMRNPDPGPRRYTSLAWAAVLGHEETFEFLLNAGHDDEELSKDVENNTILTLLADLRPGTTTPIGATTSHPDLMGAALRMARLYYERYPFILEWSNLQGKTALHVAALKGNEELVRMLCDMGADIDLPDNLGNTPLHYASAWGHVPILQLLIERGCQFAARNNGGYTASDYAYSLSTMNILQETARSQFEANKKARRQVFQQAAARGNEFMGYGVGSSASESKLFTKATKEKSLSAFRFRSGSGSSRPSAISNDGGEAIAFSRSPPPLSLSGLNHSSSSPSSHFNHSAVSSTGSHTRLPSSHRSGHPSSSSISTISSLPSAQPDAHLLSYNTVSAPASRPGYALSPIVSRMRERDADAIAEYKKRNRRDSAGTSETRSSSGPMSSFVHGSSIFPRNHFFGPTSVADRRLRSSVSAAQLRSSPPPAQFNVDPADQPTPRGRSGTNPSTVFHAAPTTELSRLNLSTSSSNKPRSMSRPALHRSGNLRNSEAEDYTGPSENFAIFPPPPEERSRTHNTSGSVSSKNSTPTARRAAFAALLSRPSPSFDLPGGANGQRAHKRGISTSELKG